MPQPEYVSLNALLDGGVAPPDTLDAMTFEYRGVRVYAYGVLHGMGGGATGAYRAFVRRSVAAAPGLVVGEMQFRRFYGPGITVETDDFLEIPFRDAARMALRATNPLYMAGMLLALVRERRQADPFGADGHRALRDLPGSPSVHRLHPHDRRALRQFPMPEQALRINLQRRHGAWIVGPRFRHPDLLWFEAAEPYANIPFRSIHMLEFAVETARRTGAVEVSIFVGETHQSDMAWFAQADLDALFSGDDRTAIEAARTGAREHAARRLAGHGTPRRAAYHLAHALGAAPFSGLLAVGLGHAVAALL